MGGDAQEQHASHEPTSNLTVYLPLSSGQIRGGRRDDQFKCVAQYLGTLGQVKLTIAPSLILYQNDEGITSSRIGGHVEFPASPSSLTGHGAQQYFAGRPDLVAISTAYARTMGFLVWVRMRPQSFLEVVFAPTLSGGLFFLGKA